MSNIPTFNDVCGTVVESLAETILNREKTIIQLREENDRLREDIRVLNNTIESRRDWSIKNRQSLANRYLLEIRQLHDEIRRLNGNQPFVAPMWRNQATNGEKRSDSDPATGTQYGDLA